MAASRYYSLTTDMPLSPWPFGTQRTSSNSFKRKSLEEPMSLFLKRSATLSCTNCSISVRNTSKSSSDWQCHSMSQRHVPVSVRAYGLSWTSSHWCFQRRSGKRMSRPNSLFPPIQAGRPDRSMNRQSPWDENVSGEGKYRLCAVACQRTYLTPRLFGPENIPLLQVGFLGLVEVDTAFHVRLTDLDDFKATVRPRTWNAVEHWASDLRQRNIKIAFFSATPQGGGVALMRHALVRFSYSLGTNIKW